MPEFFVAEGDIPAQYTISAGWSHRVTIDAVQSKHNGALADLLAQGWFGSVLPQGLFCPKAGKDPSDLFRAAKLLGERRAKRGAQLRLAGTQQAPLTENKPKTVL